MKITNIDYKWNGSLSKRNKTTKIVVHHAAAKSCTCHDIHSWHQKKNWAGIGYHFFVRKDGSVYTGRPENTIGAHAYGANSISLGICFEGNFETEIMPAAQLASGKALIASLLSKYKLSTDSIVPHSSVNATACPGKNFPLSEMLSVDAEQNTPPTENLVKSFQLAAIADSFTFKKYGADGIWGAECAKVAKKAIVKKRNTYLYPSLTKLVQRLLGATADGKCGPVTEKAIKAYQTAHRLSADGAVGLNTWKCLLNV